MEKTKTTEKAEKTEGKSADRYIEAIGRRKTSSARVRITPAPRTTYLLNDKDLNTYFPTEEMRLVAVKPLKDGKFGTFKVTVVLKGGGIHSQAEALSHALARVLIKSQADLRKELKKDGFLKRDARMKERRKFGLKKARKAPKWSKR